MNSDHQTSRREFLESTGAAITSASLVSAQTSGGGEVPRRPLGSTGLQVSIIGVGGYHLGSASGLDEARRIVDTALDAGINFFDNAWDYHKGRSEEWLGAALQGKRDRAVLMTKVCTHGRDKNIAMRMLEESLRRLQTDHLDVWQIHEVIYDNDPDLIFRPNGAAEALVQAKKDGKVRFVGFTGHKDPSIHLKMLSHNFPFDTVQMPLNCFDASFRSFEMQVLPELHRRGIAPLGMKSMGGSGEMVRHGAVTAAEALQYATSLSSADFSRSVPLNCRGCETAAVSRQPTAAGSCSKPPRSMMGTSAANNTNFLPPTNCRSSSVVARALPPAFPGCQVACPYAAKLVGESRTLRTVPNN